MAEQDYGILPLLVALAITLLSLWFGALILRKAGLSPWWTLTLLIPLGNVVAIWVFSLARWPRVEGPPSPIQDLAAPAPELRREDRGY